MGNSREEKRKEPKKQEESINATTEVKDRMGERKEGKDRTKTGDKANSL
jgi:hypothetical protein